MEIQEQSGLRELLNTVALPKVALVRQHFPRDEIEDVPALLREKLNREELKARIKPGMTVVLTGSSRQVANMPAVLRELAVFVKGLGANPTIIPAMGSHGGATAEGQREVLISYGITEEACGCPIFSSMETVQVGTYEPPEGVSYRGDEVRMDSSPMTRTPSSLWGASRGTRLSAGPMSSVSRR